MQRAYYNEIDPRMAAWIVELMKDGLIAEGDIDTRSIEDIRPDELRKYTQLHFFAGIAVWSHALRQLGWPDDRRIITGSCPCQPYSSAGKRKGFADERHLWPAYFHIIHALQGYPEFRAVPIIGEQVSSADILPWFDLVSDDLEGIGYTVWALDFPACSVGGPHIRNRLYFVADALGKDPVSLGRRGRRDGGTSRNCRQIQVEGYLSLGGPLADSTGDGLRAKQRNDGEAPRLPANNGRLENSSALSRRRGEIGGLGNGHSERCQEQRDRLTNEPQLAGIELPSFTNGFWRDVEWIYCRDEKFRPTKPGLFPLAHGSAGRVVLLRGSGNAIVPEAAEMFLKSFLSL